MYYYKEIHYIVGTFFNPQHYLQPLLSNHLHPAMSTLLLRRQ